MVMLCLYFSVITKLVFQTNLTIVAQDGLPVSASLFSHIRGGIKKFVH